MERFVLHHLSRRPGSAFLWTDLSMANVVVAAFAVITSHVIELARRAEVLKRAMGSEKAPARQAGCPYG